MPNLESAQVRLTSWSSEVYEPSDDTFLLVDAIASVAEQWLKQPPRIVVELGCGSGFAICSVALMLKQLGIAARMLAIDHSPAALQATATTLKSHQVQGVELLQSDLFTALDPGIQGHVDVLVFNPPYVPTPDEEVARGGIASAWAGGHRGRRVIDRVLAQLPGLMAPGGELFMVTVSENDPQGIIQEMQQHGFTGEVIMSRQADEETLSIVRLKKAA
mmetsp:Transcript_7417/g.18421  ORF Transcript_7417/g.18421 Transcript_7417/m.18421 type:complete len:218 (-) Transcript_7417:344-997(-)